MKEFKPFQNMDIKELLESYLPAEHVEQDKVYLEARRAWARGEGDRVELADRMDEAYQGTSFQKKHYPDKQ